MEENRKREDAQKNLCRDFLRNACDRGIWCKYLHNLAQIDKESDEKLIFCHDFQNGKCSRIDCKFVHCPKEQEKFYLEHGKMPNDYEAEQLSHIRPICKDYQKGGCRRNFCKFRHIPLPPNPNIASPFDGPVTNHAVVRSVVPENNYGGPVGIRRQHDFEDFDLVYKRKRYQDMPSPPEHLFCSPNPNEQLRYESNGYAAAFRSSWSLEEENVMLRKQMAELNKRVNNLQATNEFLLEQNAQLRNDKQVPRLTAVTVPAVTITNTASLPPQTPTAHQIVNAIRTVTASVATVPVSLAAVGGTPVSIATVSMAPVQMSPVVTMAAPQALNHTLGNPRHATGSPCPPW